MTKSTIRCLALILALVLAAPASGQETVSSHSPARADRRGVGLGVDAQGDPVVDPTRNVLDLVDAATRRSDDLAAADRRYYDAQVQHLKDLVEIRATHQRQLDAAESARIDSIRQVDVLATATTAAQALAAIQTLATSQAAQAETLRLAVADTATTIAAQLANTTAETNKRITSLEQGAYEGAGRQKLADPQLERLSEVVEKLAAREATVSGQTQGVSTAWLVLIGGVGLIATLITIVAAIGATFVVVQRRLGNQRRT